VDAIAFTIVDGKLKVLLIVRDRDPFAGARAIPGVFVRANETLEEAADRVLRDKGWLTNATRYIEQLYTFGLPGRDPRGRVVSVSYLSLVYAPNATVLETPSRAEWFDVSGIPRLAFDHEGILKYAIQRLKWKAEYTTAVFAFLPGEFTIASIRSIYEAILEKRLDKSNFWKKMTSLGIVEDTGRVEAMGREGNFHRPGKLYRLAKPVGEMIDIF
jgi:8-oxo-dGTP diphosphatase